MSIRQAELTIPALQVAYPTNPDFDGLFVGDISVALMTGAGAQCWVSLDGFNDHLHMVAGGPAAAYTFGFRYQRAWFRTAGVAVVVQAIVETEDN